MKMRTAMLTALLFALSALAPAAADERTYSSAELQQLLAPIALHPDGVLSNILIASTFPLQVVQAARWSRENPRVDGDAALAAVADRAWDPSVKALVAFPEVLARMDEDLDWTQRIGEAFMFQEAMVMDSIQALRDRAYAAGNLKTTEHVRVVRQAESIVVEPVRREVVYVPYYDTRVVYGPSWWAPAYPPVYWSQPRGYRGSSLSLYWGRPVYVSSSYYYSDFFWPQRHIVVVNSHRHAPRRWHHTPRRRPPVYQGHADRPHREAHREWADGRRETFPRGLRGPSRTVSPERVQQRRVQTQHLQPPAPTQPVTPRAVPPRQIQSRPLAPNLDAERPRNQFESRGVDRLRVPAQRRQAAPVSSQPHARAPSQPQVRATPQPRPARAERASNAADAPAHARGEPSGQRERQTPRER